MTEFVRTAHFVDRLPLLAKPLDGFCGWDDLFDRGRDKWVSREERTLAQVMAEVAGEEEKSPWEEMC